MRSPSSEGLTWLSGDGIRPSTVPSTDGGWIPVVDHIRRYMIFKWRSTVRPRQPWGSSPGSAGDAPLAATSALYTSLGVTRGHVSCHQTLKTLAWRSHARSQPTTAIPRYARWKHYTWMLSPPHSTLFISKRNISPRWPLRRP